MHFYVVIDGEAHPNHIWLPYFHWMRWDIQRLVNTRVNLKFKKKIGRAPTSSRDDMNLLDQIAISVLCEYVPARGFKQYLSKLRQVELESSRVKEVQEKVVTDMKKYLPQVSREKKEDKKES